MQDRFSKWLEMRLLRRATAPAVTTHIAEAIIFRHGCPDTILSDNGTQLRSSKLAKMLAAHNVRHVYAPVHAPHCNPVERTNRVVKTMISQYVDRNHRNWDERIPELQFAYNTARHEATGYTPAYLIFGREPISPLNRETAPSAAAAPPDETRRHLEEAYELVRVHLARVFQRQEKYYNLRRRQWAPKVGEWVWKREYPLANKAAAFNVKLAPKFRGPLEVRRIVSPVIVDLRDKSGKWSRHIHVQDLKPAPAALASDVNEEDNDTETNTGENDIEDDGSTETETDNDENTEPGDNDNNNNETKSEDDDRAED
ncbi:uncharacterized protein K02A2.6-like [Temnothorax curvispinosus]|uniref:Uncharacterized protein K02A2.6-like n=1 Tax=Temnothorax curvispinosus TaxID=300111 RepID=A0A6J1Q6K1_9HYME|nr:uncharacterized protein K02A2.6-like [Temnothorax curvispinosus]